METYFFLWKDSIVLKWNGVLPGEVSLQGNLFAADRAKAALPHLKHIANYAKYNEKMDAYLIPLSKQNLWRVYRQFGKINISAGHHFLEDFKTRAAAFKKMEEHAAFLKGAVLDNFAIPYKMPPLGDYQHRGVVLLSEVERLPLFAGCGLGKTFMVLVSTETMIQQGKLGRGKTLICGKLATLYSGWLEDVKKFTNLKAVAVWSGSSYKRKEKLRALLAEEADLYIINHEGLKVLKEDLIAKSFDRVIVDESTVLKSFHSTYKNAKGGSFGKALMEVAHNASWRVIMSGTPAPNGADDLWGQFKFLDPDGFLLEKTFSNFKQSYMQEIVFGKKDDPNAPRTWKMDPEKVPEIAKLVEPLAYRVRMEDHLKEMPDLTTMSRVVYMNDEQEKHYKNLATEFFTEIAKADGDAALVAVTVVISLMIKFSQITGGFLYDENKEPLLLGVNPKLEELDSLLYEEIGLDHKVVIFAQHDYEIKAIESRYKEFGTVSVCGANNGKTNLANIDTFINDPSTRIIILHPKSAAHGITLTVSHYMIFYASSFSYEEYYQAVHRIKRAGQKHAMFVYHLVCGDSTDELKYSTIRRKELSQATLIDGAEDNTHKEVWLKLSDHLVEKYPTLAKKHRRSHGSGREDQTIS